AVADGVRGGPGRALPRLPGHRLARHDQRIGGRPDAALADFPRGHAVHAPTGGGLIAPGPVPGRSRRGRHLVSPAPAGPAATADPRTADHAVPAGAGAAATAHPAQAQVGRAPDTAGPDLP